jgi:tetratricopeptide (TPR) repeat protein
MRSNILPLVLGAVLLIAIGAGFWRAGWFEQSAGVRQGEQSTAFTASRSDIALIPQKGDTRIDDEIRSLQNEARSKHQPPEVMKRLGWAFVRKARLSYDPGYYKLAEQCALAVESQRADDPDALLLQGHILQSLHRFKEAESIARKLVNVRRDPADQGLLGDVLMEQGNLTEAVAAYQHMVNLRPDLQSYTRVANLRWLKGDLDGAIEVIQMAATAASPREPEPGAWAYTRLGIYSLEAGQLDVAETSAAFALEYAHDYPPALLLRGRILLAQGKPTVALPFLRQAAALNPLPEYQWILADTLSLTGEAGAAQAVEQKLMATGATNDPRTFALFLASRRERLTDSLQLAFNELETRQDVFTMDALAWALRANGRLIEALDYSRKSLAEGTQDARLFYHAGCIAMECGNRAGAAEFFGKANRIKQMLFPSERSDLNQQFAALKEIETTRPIAQQ